MTFFLVVAALLGWIVAVMLFAVLGIISQIYVAQKQTILTLLENNKELQKNAPIDWNQWVPPYD